MRRISGTNSHTMVFYYQTNPLVDFKAASDRVDTNAQLYCQVYKRPSRLTEYLHVGGSHYCPTCMHDTNNAPYCGWKNCATIQDELEIENDWCTPADCSETSDCDILQTDDWDDYYVS